MKKKKQILLSLFLLVSFVFVGYAQDVQLGIYEYEISSNSLTTTHMFNDSGTVIFSVNQSIFLRKGCNKIFNTCFNCDCEDSYETNTINASLFLNVEKDTTITKQLIGKKNNISQNSSAKDTIELNTGNGCTAYIIEHSWVDVEFNYNIPCELNHLDNSYLLLVIEGNNMSCTNQIFLDTLFDSTLAISVNIDNYVGKTTVLDSLENRPYAVYRAKEEIIMEDGFIAAPEPGEVFYAYIDDCINPVNCKKEPNDKTTETNNNQQKPQLSHNEIYNHEKQSIHFKLYPNPNSGNFTLEMPQPSQVVVYNAMGKEVERLSVNRPRVTVDISGHPKGVYLVRAITESRVFTEKVVVE